MAPAKPVPPNGSSLDFNSSVERLQDRAASCLPLLCLGHGAPLPGWAQLTQPRGCPGPPENTWSHWAAMAHAMGPHQWYSQAAPHSYPPHLPTPSCSCASRTPWSPGGPFLAKAPSLWGEASSHLTEGICPFISLAKNKLSSGMCENAICSFHPKLSRPPAQSVV